MMSSFKWEIDGEVVEITFSLCRNGRWMESNGERVGIWFDYLGYEDIAIATSELEDIGEDGDMLLQVLNLSYRA